MILRLPFKPLFLFFVSVLCSAYQLTALDNRCSATPMAVVQKGDGHAPKGKLPHSLV